jgi:hypothetical protein
MPSVLDLMLRAVGILRRCQQPLSGNLAATFHYKLFYAHYYLSTVAAISSPIMLSFLARTLDLNSP